MTNINYVHRCLKMPHTHVVGYYTIKDEKIFCALKNSNERFFNEDQRQLVEDNFNELTLENFKSLPRAVINESELTIGETIIKCSVLEDGRRIIKDESLFKALDRTRKGETRIEGFPPIIGSKNLALLFNELYPEDMDTILPFEVAQYNGTTGKWYDATSIPIICDLYLEAEKRNLIIPQQQHVLEKAKILLRSFAKIGIIALIDEATNYQEIRGQNALELLLSTFISEELRAYSKEFPREYFENLFRLYGLPYDPTTSKRPRYFAKFNIKYVYEMLPPQVWQKLQEINPTIFIPSSQRKGRKNHIHRHLTDDGLKILRNHLQSLIPVMKLSSDIEDFRKNFNMVYADKLLLLEKMRADENFTLEEYGYTYK